MQWFISSGKPIFPCSPLSQFGNCNTKLSVGPYSGAKTPRASAKPKHRDNNTIPGMDTGTLEHWKCVGSITGEKYVLGLRQNIPPSLLSTQLTKVNVLEQLFDCTLGLLTSELHPLLGKYKSQI